MFTTTDEKGIINNYATEPQLYYSEYPSPRKQRNYALQGALATLLVTALVFVSFAVS
jgi:hypothetical protein